VVGVLLDFVERKSNEILFEQTNNEYNRMIFCCVKQR